MPEKLFNLFLKSRGYTIDYLQRINQPGQKQLQNIDQMCSILDSIRQTQEGIVIMPDFDCDGVSSGVVGYAGMSQLGFNVSLYMPHPEQGYGITVNDIDRVLGMYPDTKWIITCDVGQTCYDAFNYAYAHGLRVLVTDHHEQVKSPNKLLAQCIVNPCQFDEPYNQNRPDPNFNICGAFVLYQVLCRYTQLYQPNQLHLINSLAVFAGIGTEGDMMPLIQENRLLIKDTLEMLNFLYDTPNLNTVLSNVNPVYFSAFNGLKLWLQVLKENNKIYGKIDESFLGWTLVPMINAVKRLNLPMTLIFGIFFNNNSAQQQANAEKLVLANDQRKIVVKSFMGRINQEVIDHKQPFAPFIYFTDAPSGILGLLANQLKRTVNLPVFVLNKQNLSGSGRSFSYFPVISYTRNTEFKVRGHQLAFGISFTDMNQIDRFYQFLLKTLPSLVKNARKKTKYDLQLLVDSDSNRPVLTYHNGLEFIDDVAKLKPFGQGFKEPDLAIGALKNQAEFKLMGQQNQHLKIILPGNIELISWNNADKLEQLNQQDSFIFHGNLSANHFKGNTTLQMIGNLATK